MPVMTRRYWIMGKTLFIPVFWNPIPTATWADIVPWGRLTLPWLLSRTTRNAGEAITREQSLRALTINVAYAWRQEHRMGSIEVGKLANMTVFDCDFLHDDIEKVNRANVVATIVDGEEVYRA